ncbi:hypothetical protein CHLRE_06g279474v5 [Chlamydomonas reinhardtii]|uniref:Polymerase beta nucleotidyltransferase n=1 Tax=Chlamydomonas reinhardtii TaxID=3055 RepID=A0FEN2_CHLRE|nr:uncharacterized protein CHLRE_06g279474v5 [Chlamydomonas reinhardtii]ABI79451.1 polymerase beta nucleotidyltransferase [Chlamydomonas reinhardtii]PNW82450.1 hypothetical protein CHLRE_06g279474v5 [Chlamydomonas reinhardtii]
MSGPASADELAAVLEQVVQATSPTVDAYRMRTRLIDSIQGALKHRIGVQDLHVQPYGSFVSQQYNAGSDLDLALCGYIPAAKLKPAALAEIYRGEPEEELVPLHKLDKRTKANLLRDAGYRLAGSGVASRDSMEFVLHARVPIVKFADRATGIEVDLCLGNAATSFKAWSVARVAEINPAFGRLYKVVKLWAKAHGINDGASHMFNSWCLTLVVMYFLQQYPSREQALLPPLCELLYEKRPAEDSPRLMQKGAELPPEVLKVMEQRASQAAKVYGARPCPPLLELFRDFVQQCGRNLRGLLAAQESFRRGTRISAFYGQLLHSRPYASQYVLCVEDPYDDNDNTARTFGTWDGHPGTIHYVTSVFERTARRLNSILGASSAPSTSTASSSAASDAWEAESNASSSNASSSTGTAAAGKVPPQPPSLASTLVFLFGPQLVNKLPDLSRRLLGPQLHAWAVSQQGRVPAGELHTQLLKALGAGEEFMCFESFKRRHNIRVLNEVKYTTAEEKAAAALAAAAKREAKRAKDAAKRAVKNQRKEREAAAVAASTAPAPASTAAHAAAAEAAGAPRSGAAAAGHAAEVSAAAAVAAAEAAAASRPPRPNSRIAPDARNLLNRVVASTLHAGGAGAAAGAVQGRRSLDGHPGPLSPSAVSASTASADALAAAGREAHHAAEPAQSNQPYGHRNQNHRERTRPAHPMNADRAGETPAISADVSSSSHHQDIGPAAAGDPRQPGNRRQQQQSGASRQPDGSRRGPRAVGGRGGSNDRGGGDDGGGSSAPDMAAVQAAMQGLQVSRARASGGDAGAAGPSTSAAAAGIVDDGAAAEGAAGRGRHGGGRSGRPASRQQGREGSGRQRMDGGGGEQQGGGGEGGAGAEAASAAPSSRSGAPYFVGPRGKSGRKYRPASGAAPVTAAAAAAAQVLS